MRPTRSLTRRHPFRRGYSFLELLVVIGIIALLASMALVVYARSGESARIAGTKTLLRILDSALQQRLEAFRRYDFGPVAQARFGADTSITRTFARKYTFRNEFPQRFQDLYGYDDQPGDSNASQSADNSPLWFLIRKKPSMAGKSSTQLESLVSNAELLYLILVDGSSYGLPPVDISTLGAQYITDADDDGLPEFVDGWGQPLVFFNAPTGLLRPKGNVYDANDMSDNQGEPILLSYYNQAKLLIRSLPAIAGDLAYYDYTNPLNIDPHDLLGEIHSSQQNGSITKPDPPTFANETGFENYYHAADTFFTPLIVSGGPDQASGLFPPTTTGKNRLCVIQTISEVYDNLTNHQRGGL